MATRKRWGIEVTADDLVLGEMRDSNRCAVKRAVERDIPGAKRVEVDLQTIRFSRGEERHVYLTPWQVAEYVIAFDAGDGGKMHPFEFTLRSPVEIGSKVRRKTFTEEGLEIDAARSRLRKAQAKKERALEVLQDADSTGVEQAQAAERLEMIDDVIAERERDLQEVRATVKESGKPVTKTVDGDKPRPPRRHKTRTRNFGMRALRVNQAEGRTHVT